MQAALAVADRLAAYGRFLGAARVDLPTTLPKLLQRRLAKRLN